MPSAEEWRRLACLEGLIDEAPGGILAANQNGRFTYVNHVGAEILGFEPAELLGMQVSDLIPAEAAAAEHPPSSDSREPGAPEPALWLFRRKDGSHMPIEVSARVLANGAWIALFHDVSRAKRAESQMWRLASASRMLSASLELDTILATCAEIVVPDLADGLVIRLVADDGTFRMAKAAHCDPRRQLAFEDYARRAEAASTVQKLFENTIAMKMPLVVRADTAGADGHAAIEQFKRHDPQGQFGIHSFVVFRSAPGGIS